MDRVVKLNPDTLAVPPDNMHAHIVIAPRGARLAFIAGQVALDRDFQVIGGGSHGEQARQCFTNIRLALQAIDATPDQITQMTIIVVRYEEALMADINQAGRAVFGDDWPVTATTLIGATALGHSAFLIEVSAVVALPD